MIFDHNDVDALALCSWKESRGEGALGCAAQMHVVCNRVGKPGFGHTIHDVIYGKNQFTSMSVPSDPEFTLSPHYSDTIYQACLAAAPIILGGNVPDPTKGAVYYANEVYVTSGWYLNNIINRPDLHPITVVIGHHTFRT